MTSLFSLLSDWRRTKDPRFEIHSSQRLSDFVGLPLAELPGRLRSRVDGLSHEEAAKRLSPSAQKSAELRSSASHWQALRNQLRSPLLAILLFALLVAAISGQTSNSLMMSLIALATIGIGYSREYRAHAALIRLLQGTGSKMLPPFVLLVIVSITATYAIVAELLKGRFFRRFDRDGRRLGC